MNLLTKSNAKLVKTFKNKGYVQEGMHLAPHKTSGKNTCSHASVGCAAACLNTAGFGVYDNVQKARIRRTHLFFTNRQLFLEKLHKEISNSLKRNLKKGYVPSFRLNLTSDVAWESIKYNGKSMMEHFPSVRFYDYTSNPNRMIRFLTGDFPKNYHLTFSRKENNDSACDIILGCGGNVSMVFNKIPKKYKGYRVISGMSHDMRFMDPKNVIVGLLPLRKAKSDKTGFLIKI